MAGRIRTIKPELLDDEKASALSDAAWRLFVSSWLLADDHGRFRAGARYLAASVWQDTTRTGDATAALAELVQAGRVRVYDVDGQTYAEIPTWARHQRIDNAGKPRVPPPPGMVASDSEHLHAVSPRVSASLRESPRFAAKASESAALPPTTTTTTTNDQRKDPGFAGSEPSGSGNPPPDGPTSAHSAEAPSPQGDQPPSPQPNQAVLLPVEAPAPSPAEHVFAAYLESRKRVHPGTRPPRFDTKRKRLIVARLGEYSREDLELAARGVWLSEWHVAQGQTHIELVFRDGQHVEKFRDIALNPELGRERRGATGANGVARMSTLQQGGTWRPKDAPP